MRKIVVVLMLCSVLINLCGCSSMSKGVPDEIVQLDAAEEFGGQDCAVYVDHEVDKTTHLDHISVSVEVNVGFGKEIYNGTADYLYNRADDNWSIYNGYDWQYITTLYDDNAFLGVYEGTDFPAAQSTMLRLRKLTLVTRRLPAHSVSMKQNCTPVDIWTILNLIQQVHTD